MFRRALASIAYNAYSGALVWAFQINTAYAFDAEMVRRIGVDGGFDSPSHWGWSNYYLWRLCAASTATVCAAVLAGAIAHTRGGLTAALGFDVQLARGAERYWSTSLCRAADHR